MKTKPNKRELIDTLESLMKKYPPQFCTPGKLEGVPTSMKKAYKEFLERHPEVIKFSDFVVIYTPGESPKQMAEQIIQGKKEKHKLITPKGVSEKGTGKKTGTHTKTAVRHHHEEPFLNAVPGRRVLSPGIAELLRLKGSKNKAKLQHIAELEAKGADVNLIMNAIVFPSILWQKKTGIFDMNPDIRKTDLKFEKRIRKALECLAEELPPVFPNTSHGQNVNRKMVEMQAELKAVLKRHEQDLREYFDLKLAEPYLYDLVKEFPKDIIFRLNPPCLIADMCRIGLKSTKRLHLHLWNESVVVIVDELRSIGYSWNQSYEETATLLNLFYPDIYRRTDPDLIRQRYTYHTRNPKTPATPNKTPQK